jgi:hypothetical protein
LLRFKLCKFILLGVREQKSGESFRRRGFTTGSYSPIVYTVKTAATPINNYTFSMTENGDPLENAIAERVNGIIKEEYLKILKK